jgi:hypothetical protein
MPTIWVCIHEQRGSRKRGASRTQWNGIVWDHVKSGQQHLTGLWMDSESRTHGGGGRCAAREPG